MSYTVALRLSRAERVLERLVALVGRRGYEVVGIDAALESDGRHFSVELTVASERSADLLLRQLGRLQEVAEVGLAGSSPSHP